MAADPDSRRLPLPGPVTVAFCLSVMALVAVGAGFAAAVAVLVVHVSAGAQSYLSLAREILRNNGVEPGSALGNDTAPEEQEG